MSIPTLKMNIPCTSEFVGVVRLAVSGVASRMQFSIEEIEDIKISVSEACTNSVQHAYAETNSDNSISVTCALHPEHLEIIVEDKGKGFNIDEMKTKGKPQIDEDKIGLGLGLTFIR
ncbi:MAG: serine/threonine-protein kinase RsbW, partial [Candidatus Marinamargulisbacteria bacterium]